MITEDQGDVIRWLESPGAHGGGEVARIDTHSAIVFLTGDRAYKLKRAVAFDYLDFSSAELRRHFCNAEVTLNRRTAPGLYRRVVPVTRQPDGTLALDGTGPPLDWVIEMTRFPQDCLFDRLAAAGRLDLALIDPLADHIAAFHASADPRFDHGGQRGMRWVADGNTAGFAEFGRCLDTSACAQLTAHTTREIDRHAALLDQRLAIGRVRHCHGDLHLGNIVLLDGRPTLFDGIEFNDEIACIDVLYDIAFLLMDLWHRTLPGHANALLNRYLAAPDLDGLALLPLFLSCRAAVKAKTSATAAQMQSRPEERSALERQAREYFVMAEALLHPPPPRLIAIGGLSGSGKSTLARAVAPFVGAVPGAFILRSDEIRKRLCNVLPLDRLDPDGYAPSVTARVYETLAVEADRVLRTGHSVVVDAVYGDSSERTRLERVAQDAKVPFVGLWLDAPASTLIARVTGRRYDVSDADADVVRMQLARDSGEISWRRIDAADSPEHMTGIALGLLSDG
ncbi:MAG: AAA family ATPase [Vicinamibacterales bacterium]